MMGLYQTILMPSSTLTLEPKLSESQHQKKTLLDVVIIDCPRNFFGEEFFSSFLFFYGGAFLVKHLTLITACSDFEQKRNWVSGPFNSRKVTETGEYQSEINWGHFI